jgi:hypothetical protein
MTQEEEAAIAWWAEETAKEFAQVEAAGRPGLAAVILSPRSLANRRISIARSGNVEQVLAAYRRHVNANNEARDVSE